MTTTRVGRGPQGQRVNIEYNRVGCIIFFSHSIFVLDFPSLEQSAHFERRVFFEMYIPRRKLATLRIHFSMFIKAARSELLIFTITRTIRARVQVTTTHSSSTEFRE